MFYVQVLLGIDPVLESEYEKLLVEDDRLNGLNLKRRCEILKPGFTRLNLAYFEEEEAIEYILSAVALVAQHGWRMLPHVSTTCKFLRIHVQ